MPDSMISGKLYKALIRFSIPLILSGLLQQLYNWADALIVGNIEGELSLAAIGMVGLVSGLAVWMITGFAVGISVLAAQLYGEGRHEAFPKILSTFTVVLLGLFTVLAVACIAFSKSILQVLQTPPDFFDIADSYFVIVSTGIPFLAVYNVYGAVLRGMGDSRTPFLSVAVSSLCNVALDLLFVAAFRWGAAGAAAATVLSQGLMTVFIVRYSTKKYESMRFRLGKGMVDADMLRSGLRLSLPTAAQASIRSVGSLFLQNFMNSFGTQTVAAITTAYRVDMVILLPVVNLSAGISTAVAQNTGAGNSARAKKALYVGAALTGIVCVVLMLMIVPAGGMLVGLFGVTAEAAEIGGQFFRTIALYYLPFGLMNALKGYLEGTGDVLFSSVCTAVVLFIRILLSYQIAALYGNRSIAIAEAWSWILLLALFVLRFLYNTYSKKAARPLL